MTFVCVLLAASLSIWDYPARQFQHERLRAQFVTALRGGDTATMEETCRKGVALLPDDPTWHYNLACSLAYFPGRSAEAFDELERAIDYGFRDLETLRNDADLKRLSGELRYAQLLVYAEEMSTRTLMRGPMATVDATGVFGTSIALGQQNLVWDFESGSFVPRLRLATGAEQPWTGDLYMNRDRNHSRINVREYPGITEVKLDGEGCRREMDVNLPNIVFPYPLFGNCSRAFVGNPFWRSLSRAAVTSEATRLKVFEKAYLSNQIWVFPSNADTAPVGTNGDVFASITPYFLTTAGKSWSDLPYLRAALLASAALPKKVKAEIVKRGLLAPTIQVLLRKSLRTVKTEEDYTSFRAHPTALPPDGVETNRLKAAARAMTVEAIPPVVGLSVRMAAVKDRPVWPELTYAMPLAWAFVLRSTDAERTFSIEARGAKEYKFVQTHGEKIPLKIDQIRPDAVNVTFRRLDLSPVNRLDIAVFGRNPGTGWGAPSYVCFARMDPEAPYSDPLLTPRGDTPAK